MRYRTKSILVNAIQFRGGIESTNRVREFVNKYGFLSTWHMVWNTFSVEIIKDPSQWATGNVGDWFIYEPIRNRIEVVSNEDFLEKYELMEN